MGSRTYSKECVVEIENVDMKEDNLDYLIDKMEESIGVGNVYAVIPRRPDILEVTVKDKTSAEKLSTGLKIGEKHFKCRIPYSPFTVVSFMDIPPYIEDRVLIEKLRIFNIEIDGEVVRHFHDKHKTVENGIRHVRCIFPPEIKALPWGVKLESINGIKNYRVIHNNQIKVCNKCCSDDHMIADCPQIKCRRCHQYGHFGNLCTIKVCHICKHLDTECICSDYFEDGFNCSANNLSDDSSENQLTNIDPDLNSISVNSNSISSVPEQKSKKLRLDTDQCSVVNEPVSESTRVDNHPNLNDLPLPDTDCMIEPIECDNEQEPPPLPLPSPPPPSPPQRVVSRKEFHIMKSDRKETDENPKIYPTAPVSPYKTPRTRRNILVTKPDPEHIRKVVNKRDSRTSGKSNN